MFDAHDDDTSITHPICVASTHEKTSAKLPLLEKYYQSYLGSSSLILYNEDAKL